MKIFITAIAICAACISLKAQEITLSQYQQGKFHSDTIYSYLGDLPSRGLGNISLGTALEEANFVDGLEFVIVFDSVSHPGHAFADEGGARVGLTQGDVMSLPIGLEVFQGVIGFHIVIRGTPLTASQAYPCDLGIAFTLGQDFGMGIFSAAESNCAVDPISATKLQSSNVPQLSLYPNPVSDIATIDLTSFEGLNWQLSCSNMMGAEVYVMKGASGLIQIDCNEFPSGAYIFQLTNEFGASHYGWFQVE